MYVYTNEELNSYRRAPTLFSFQLRWVLLEESNRFAGWSCKSWWGYWLWSALSNCCCQRWPRFISFGHTRFYKGNYFSLCTIYIQSFTQDTFNVLIVELNSYIIHIYVCIYIFTSTESECYRLRVYHKPLWHYYFDEKKQCYV